MSSILNLKTNGWIYDLHLVEKRPEKCVTEILLKCSEYAMCNQSSLGIKVIKAVQHMRLLIRKRRSTQLADYLKQKFEPTTTRCVIENTDIVSQSDQVTCVTEINKQAKLQRHQLEHCEDKVSQLKLEKSALLEVQATTTAQLLKVQKLETEISENYMQLQGAYEVQSAELNNSRDEIATLKEKIPLLKSRKRDLDRKDDTIKKLKYTISSGHRIEKKVTVMEQKLDDVTCKLENKCLEFNDVTTACSILKAKSAASEERSISLQQKIVKLTKQLYDKKRQFTQLQLKVSHETSEKDTLIIQSNTTIHALKSEITDLQSFLACLESNEVRTFQNGKYTQEMRECCMELLTSGNVSLRKIPVVIKTVMTHLTGKLPTRIPSQALLSDRIMTEAKIVALKQVLHNSICIKKY